MQSTNTTLHPQTSHCDASGDDVPELQPGEFACVSGNLSNKGTGATAAACANTSATSPGGGAQADHDDHDALSSSSSDGEESDITAVKQEMIRYVNRGPPRPPSHGHSVPRNPRPPPPPPATGTSKTRPPAVTLGPGTTAKPKSPKK